ncbi:MAG: hypothetical protein RIQ56_335, partial [Candidatus Parcubacteria bacterium]
MSYFPENRVLILQGVPYVRANDVAKNFNITREYLGQLARDKKILAHREGKFWFVNEDSVRSYVEHQSKEDLLRAEKLRMQRIVEYKHFAGDSVRVIDATRKEPSVPAASLDTEILVPILSRVRSLEEKLQAATELQRSSIFSSPPVAMTSPMPKVPDRPSISTGIFRASAIFSLAGMIFFSVAYGTTRVAVTIAPQTQPAGVGILSYFENILTRRAEPSPKLAEADLLDFGKIIFTSIDSTVQKRQASTTTFASANQNVSPAVRIVERIIREISPPSIPSISAKDLFDLETRLNNKIALLGDIRGQSVPQVSAGGYYSYTSSPIIQKVDQLFGTTITNPIISGGTITGSSISTQNLSITTSLSLPGISGLLFSSSSAMVGTSTLAPAFGGTGYSAYTVGDILYANSTTSLSRLGVGTNGQVLKVTGGLLGWGTDNSGSGGASAWATSTDNLSVSTTDPSQVVLIGSSATTTGGNILEVSGNSLLRGQLIVQNSISSSRFVATSSVASVLPYSSSTAITVSGAASTSNLIVSNSFSFGSASGLLKAVAGSISTALANLSSDVTGILSTANGGTGTSSTPTYGQLLVGNGSGYTLSATSTLGLPTFSDLSSYALNSSLFGK